MGVPRNSILPCTIEGPVMEAAPAPLPLDVEVTWDSLGLDDRLLRAISKMVRCALCFRESRGTSRQRKSKESPQPRPEDHKIVELPSGFKASVSKLPQS